MGHGCFGTYVFRFKIVSTPVCIICNFPEDDVVHTIFHCGAWEVKRRHLYKELGEELTPENIGGNGTGK